MDNKKKPPSLEERAAEISAVKAALFATFDPIFQAALAQDPHTPWTPKQEEARMNIMVLKNPYMQFSQFGVDEGVQAIAARQRAFEQETHTGYYARPENLEEEDDTPASTASTRPKTLVEKANSAAAGSFVESSAAAASGGPLDSTSLAGQFVNTEANGHAASVSRMMAPPSEENDRPHIAP